MSWLDELRATLGGMQAPLQALQPAAQSFTENVTVPAANAAMTGVHVAGDVLDTPGSVLRGIGAGVGNELRGDDGGDYLRRALQGITDPSQRVTGQEVNQNAGLGGGALGGMATQLLSDPIAMGMAARTAQTGGSALLRMLRGGESALPEAGLSASQAGRLAPAQGVGGYNLDPVNGWQRLEPLSPAANTNRYAANGAQLFGEGATPANTAEAWTGRSPLEARQSLAAALQPAGEATQAGPVSNLLPLRRNLTVVRDARLDFTGRPVGVQSGGNFEDARRALQEYAYTAGNAGIGPNARSAAAYPSINALVLPEGTTPNIARHEIMHGLINNAVQGENASGLPLMPRMVANAQMSENPIINALGHLGEETVAHGAENRGLLPQLGRMYNFLNNPVSGYTQQFRGYSPLAAQLYADRAIPKVLKATGAAGAAVGAGGLADIGNALFGGQ